MFLDQELKNIQQDKNRLAICCDLRRRLVHIEVQSVRSVVRRSLLNLNLGVAVIEYILRFLRERKDRHR